MNHPTWRFAPTGGGAEQGNNPGQQYFANNAVEKMVRETLQNSLDHHEDGLDGVHVAYRLIEVEPSTFGVHDLIGHVRSTSQEAKIHHSPETRQRYEEMDRMTHGPTVPCLAVTDSNTTGLQGENWDNLIFREGTPTITGGMTKGGSYGFGKNAPFNLSGLNTMLYSTRYVSRAERGRVTKMAGRSQLMSHDDPGDPALRLQSVGFYAVHDAEKPNQPVMGPDIPGPFHLEECGTGIFIAGFDVNRAPDWEEQIAKVAVSQFFPAICRGDLTVAIEPGQGALVRRIDQHSLDTEMEALDERSTTRHYYQAMLQKPQTTGSSGKLDQMGQLKVWIGTAKTAPRRLAHVNRRGMLITDERNRKQNPLHPTGGTQWSPWCAVTMAQDERTDKFIRLMEPPAHDAIQPGQLRDKNAQENAGEELRRQRDQIVRMVKERIENDNLLNAENVLELAGLFPDMPGQGKGQTLKVTERQYRENNDQRVDIEPDTEEELEYPDPDRDSAEDENHEEGGRPQDGVRSESPDGPPENRTTSPLPAATTLRRVRIIRTSPETLAMTLMTPERDQGPVKFGLRAAGEQYQRAEKTIGIKEIRQESDITVQARIQGNEVVVEAPPNSQVNLHITLSEPDEKYHSYRLAGKQEENS